MTIGHEFVGVVDLVVVTECFVTFVSFVILKSLRREGGDPASSHSRGRNGVGRNE
jgi:hypothetical protein